MHQMNPDKFPIFYIIYICMLHMFASYSLNLPWGIIINNYIINGGAAVTAREMNEM